MKKRLLLIAGLVCLLVVAGTFLWRVTRPIPPASKDRIPLPDGSWVHLEAVTYGTNHLVGPRLAMLAHKLPPPMQLLILRVFGKHASMRFMTTTPTPQLVLWLNRGPYANRFPPNMGYMKCYLTDANGFAAGEAIDYGAPYPLEAKPFSIFPRRDPEFVLRIYHHDVGGGAAKECGQMRIANPLYRSYPGWKAESLPTTKRIGDVEATLHRVIANVPMRAILRHQRSGQGWEVIASSPNTAEPPVNICQLLLRTPGKPKAVWEVAGLKVSDATGNRAGPQKVIWDRLEDDWFKFSPGLWTNEAAWKLSFEIKRTAGFQTNELFTFRNVPLGQLGQSSRIGWTTNGNGVTVTLASVQRREPVPWYKVRNLDASSTHFTQVEFEISGLTTNQHLDLIDAVANNGTPLLRTDTGGDQNPLRTYSLSNVPLDAETADFVFVVQTWQTIDFLVKPDIAPEPFVSITPK